MTHFGFAAADITTTLEIRTKCDIGKCDRCNIGRRYICLDGPVFTLEELRQLPGSVHRALTTACLPHAIVCRGADVRISQSYINLCARILLAKSQSDSCLGVRIRISI
jgi:hypothetical protein